MRWLNFTSHRATGIGIDKAHLLGGALRRFLALADQEETLRGLPILVQTDWLSQRSNWPEIAGLVQSDAERLPGRSVILMKPDGGLAGITPLDQLVARNPS